MKVAEELNKCLRHARHDNPQKWLDCRCGARRLLLMERQKREGQAARGSGQWTRARPQITAALSLADGSASQRACRSSAVDIRPGMTTRRAPKNGAG